MARHVMPFGAQIVDGGVRFALWAPSAQSVEVMIDGAGRPTGHPTGHAMAAEADGWHRLTVPGAGAGTRYRYRIDGETEIPDPASRFQPEDVFGPSEVIDAGAFVWNDAGFRARPWAETVLYEVHVGTATPQGTYAALMEKLPDIAALGVTAIELMPLSDFPGRRNWGYDGVLPFAPDSAYGTPDDLRRLIDRAHALGLSVFMDVVYNHFGPAGNYLGLYCAPFFTERHKTPWGAAINFDGKHVEPVRGFFIQNALTWIEEFHVDGLRFDAVQTIMDDSGHHFLAEIAERVRAAHPDVNLVLENLENEARWLNRSDDLPILHTAQWADDIHNAWHVVLTGEHDGYYRDFIDRPVSKLGRALAEGFAYQGETSPQLKRPRGTPSEHLPPTSFVAFLQNHDQIGNRAQGERLSALAAPEKLNLARAAFLLSPQIPLLFMGEEWAASTPFQFFVDFGHDEALSEAVRKGRREEFAEFSSFSAEAMPDPTSEETFRRCVLDWSERSVPPHADVLAEFRSLIALRQAEIVPLLAMPFEGGSFEAKEGGTLSVRWRFAGAGLTLLCNFGAEPAEFAASGAVLWSSPSARIERGRAILPAWTGAVLKETR